MVDDTRAPSPTDDALTEVEIAELETFVEAPLLSAAYTEHCRTIRRLLAALRAARAYATHGDEVIKDMEDDMARIAAQLDAAEAREQALRAAQATADNTIITKARLYDTVSKERTYFSEQWEKAEAREQALRGALLAFIAAGARTATVRMGEATPVGPDWNIGKLYDAWLNAKAALASPPSPYAGPTR